MSETKRWAIGIVVTIAVAAITLSIALLQWGENKAKTVPNLKYLSHRGENGRTIVTLQNPSSTPVGISGLTYVISDPEQLKHIEDNAPKATDDPPGRNETPNPLDETILRHGYWNGDNYEFHTDLGMHVPPNSIQDIEPRIIQEKWAEHRFSGTLTIEYGMSGRCRVENILIRGEHQD